MYIIDSKKEKPDLEYMYKRVGESIEKGVTIADIDEMHKKMLVKQAQLAADIRKNYGIFNPNSSPQVVEYLKSLNDTVITDVCFNGKTWTTKKEVLEDLVTLGYDFAAKLQEYRTIKNKCEVLESLGRFKTKEGNVHPKLSKTKTNRISYSEPALLGIPKEMCYDVIRPRVKGNRLISVDIKNQEPGIMINWLNIAELKNALTSKDGLYESIYQNPFKANAPVNIMVTTSKVENGSREVPATEMKEYSFISIGYYSPVRPNSDDTFIEGKRVEFIQPANVLVEMGSDDVKLPETVIVALEDDTITSCKVVWDSFDKKILTKPGIYTIQGKLQSAIVECTPIARREFKVSWLAMTYGASIMGVRAICKHIDGDTVYKYYNSIEPLKEYKKLCKKNAKLGVQDVKTYFGSIVSAGEFDKSRLERVLLDIPMQGTGADILALLIKHFDEEALKRGLQDKIELYYPRHDELVLEADKDWVAEIGEDAVLEICKDVFEHKVDNWIPFKVEIAFVGGNIA